MYRLRELSRCLDRVKWTFDFMGSEGLKRPHLVMREVRRYGVAVAAVGVAAACRMALGGVLKGGAPFITFYPAVAIAAMGCGCPERAGGHDGFCAGGDVAVH
jgi:hypothetical protein